MNCAALRSWMGPRIGLDGKSRKQPTRKTDPGETELRARAESLDYKMSCRGGEYRFTSKDGESGFGGITSIEQAHDQLDIVEGKVAVEYTTACGMPTGFNNAEAVAAYNAKNAAPDSARDIGLESFDAHVLELIRLVKGQKPERFAKTGVPTPLLGDMAYYLRELVAARKVEAAS
jgi:hypothetical protein